LTDHSFIFTMKSHVFFYQLAVVLLFWPLAACAQQAVPIAQQLTHSYILAPNDVVEIKVYQEDDLETKARIGQDGSISFPLIGVVCVGGRTIGQAGALIRDKLAKDYLVNPQVTLIVDEYSKRRFTVLGQVQKPGSFEIPSEETVTLLQAIAMAGGYTRLADKANVKVTRATAGETATLTLDTKRESDQGKAMSFAILPEDTVTVPERLF
jgi:protein involved in polysaccharide export with SLBB domain